MLEESPSETEAKKLSARVTYWQEQIRYALKREETFRKRGKRLVRLYESADEEQFNILFSNTETLLPALYSATPRPVVKRRFNDPDPLGRHASKVAQRILEYFLDNGLVEGKRFDSLMELDVLSALVPGRGLMRLDYQGELEQAQKHEEAHVAEKAEELPEGHPEPKPPAVIYEGLSISSVPWEHFIHGFALTWSEVPWIGYLHKMTREELGQNFGEVAIRVAIAKTSGEESDKGDISEETKTGVSTVDVWEIRSKVDGKVLFICSGYPDAPLKEVDDPLELQGFFNCVEPLRLYKKLSSLTPTALYEAYKSQAEELNTVSTRISRLVKALKVRGFYDNTIEGIDKVLEVDDNTLLPMENAAALYGQGAGGLDKSILLMPIEKLVTVLQQLYIQRQQIKQVIYEINGIADIMRGSTAASETLGAQELKSQWGSLRLKRMQKAVSNYACENMRLMLELAVTKLGSELLRKMTGSIYPTRLEKQQAQVQLQAAQAMQQQIPPALEQAMQAPAWEDILELLQNDLTRSFKVDIETNSTVDIEATEDKENIAELLTAISQFLTGVSPLVQQGSLPFEAAQGMLLAIVRRFRFGTELEDQISAMKAPAPQKDPKVEADMELKKMDIESRRQEQSADAEQRNMDMQFRREEHAMRMKELSQKAAIATQAHAMKLREMQAQAAMPPKPAPIKK